MIDVVIVALSLVFHTSFVSPWFADISDDSSRLMNWHVLSLGNSARRVGIVLILPPACA